MILARTRLSGCDSERGHEFGRPGRKRYDEAVGLACERQGPVAAEQLDSSYFVGIVSASLRQRPDRQPAVRRPRQRERVERAALDSEPNVLRRVWTRRVFVEIARTLHVGLPLTERSRPENRLAIDGHPGRQFRED